MRLSFWVSALAVLSIARAKNSTAKIKPKRQLENIRTPQNLQYSLVLPNSRVSHYRSLGTSNRRISYGTPRGNLPPYAVQMEPVVQYSQKDPLYDPNVENIDDVVNRNEIYAQPKILNIGDQHPEGSYGPPYGSLPTAPLYSHEPHHPQYYEAPEPIIEIIIKESNVSLPAPPPQPIPKKKKEPVQVFYVKYSKDPHSHDKVVYDQPIPAITPPSNLEDENEHHQDYVTVTPEPYYQQQPSTTLRAIIKPDSEVFHSDGSVKVTFGSESQGQHHSYYSDRREGDGNNEDHEETAPRPAIAYPQQPPNHPSHERAAHPNQQQFHEQRQPPPSQQFHEQRQPPPSHLAPQNYRPTQQPQHHAQSRIQFQQPFLTNEQQLPRQGPSNAPFRGQIQRQNPFSTQLGPVPSFPNSLPGPIKHFPGNAPSPNLGSVFPTSPPRPNAPPSFHPRPNSQPPFAPRPNFNGPPRPPPAFHSGPQRPFHQPPQQQPFFDEAKYLQDNYHTITTENVEPAQDQLLPSRPTQNFNFIPKPSSTPSQAQFLEHRPQHIPSTQLLPQQRPHQQFVENTHNKPTFVSPTRSPFYNLKPSPPHVDESHLPFQQNGPPQQQFSFHQGIQPLPRPVPQGLHQGHRFPALSASPSPQTIPQTQFLPQPSSPPQFNFQPQPPLNPEHPDHFQQNHLSERPNQFQTFNNPSEKPVVSHPQNNFQEQSGLQHQQNVGQFVPDGGEFIASIPKYEQHITVNGPTAQPDYSGLNQPQPSSTPSQAEHQYQQQKEQQQQQQRQQQLQQHKQQQKHDQQQRQQQHEHQQRKQQQEQTQQIQQLQQQEHQHQQQQLQNQRQQYFDAEQEQVKLQLAQNVQKQQEEIQRLQSQLLQAQQQQQQQLNFRNNFGQQKVESTSPQPQYHRDRSKSVSYQPTYATSTASPPYYQSTSRTIEIKPTTQKYASSTINSINVQEEKREQKKKRPTFKLPDEVPDDLRQQLLSSGILDNADISVLDYDKVGDTPLDSLPPDQLANFFSAGGGQQIAASEPRPIVVAPEGGQRFQARIDDEDEEDNDQEIAASENIPTYAVPAPQAKQAVEMKVVHFNPKTAEGQKLAENYVKEDATQLDPVALNDKKYNRYLPLKVSGNQFPLPEILKGRKVTSVVVLAPVETEALGKNRPAREATTGLKGIKFVAGESLQDLLKKPDRENFERWLDTEKNTAADLQSVVLLVTGPEEDPSGDKEIFMYDISSGKVNKLDGDLSNAFVEAAENNALSKDIEKLAIEGEGIPESFEKSAEDDKEASDSENVPLLVDLSGLSLDQDNSNQVSISSGYSKTKLGRSLRKH